MKKMEFRIMQVTKVNNEEVIVTLSVQTDKKKADAFLKRLEKSNALSNRSYYIAPKAIQ